MVIRIHDIEKSFQLTPFRKRQVLHKLNLKIAEGVSFGFLGPNGAGKSTTIKLLLNFLRPDKGEMYVLENKIGRDEFRSSVGYLSEFPCFYNNLTSLETLLYTGKLSGLDPQIIAERAKDLLVKVKLENTVNQRVATFSKGMKQRLGLACALIHDPEILILDEPMSGLDPVGRHLVKAIIKDICKQGKTVFFSTHILADIDQLCDTIGVIHQGHLLYSGSLRTYQEGYLSLEDAFIANINEWNNQNVT